MKRNYRNEFKCTRSCGMINRTRLKFESIINRSYSQRCDAESRAGAQGPSNGWLFHLSLSSFVVSHWPFQAFACGAALHETSSHKIFECRTGRYTRVKRIVIGVALYRNTRHAKKYFAFDQYQSSGFHARENARYAPSDGPFAASNQFERHVGPDGNDNDGEMCSYNP